VKVARWTNLRRPNIEIDDSYRVGNIASISTARKKAVQARSQTTRTIGQFKILVAVLPTWVARTLATGSTGPSDDGTSRLERQRLGRPACSRLASQCVPRN
jgi:hypothetical protein